MKRWTFALPSLALSVASLFIAPLSALQAEPDALRTGFAEPPLEAHLRCYWWWLNGNMTAETITRDLEAMKSNGYAGAILVDADGSGQEGNLEVPAGLRQSAALTGAAGTSADRERLLPSDCDIGLSIAERNVLQRPTTHSRSAF